MSVAVATDTDFQQNISDNSMVIVKYYADWCGSCRLFNPKYKRLSDDERFSDVVFLDIDAELNPDARHAAGVDNLPFFATFKDGQLLEGAATAKEDFVIGMLERVKV